MCLSRVLSKGAAFASLVIKGVCVSRVRLTHSKSEERIKKDIKDGDKSNRGKTKLRRKDNNGGLPMPKRKERKKSLALGLRHAHQGCNDGIKN